MQSRTCFDFFSGFCVSLRRSLVTQYEKLFKREENVQIIRTLDELDEMLIKLDEAAKVSDDELRRLFPTFRMNFDTNVPSDPYSEEYAKSQFDLYRRISGKIYSVENEKSVFDLDSATVRPFPYYTGSCETVGNHLAAIAHVIRSMHLRPGAKIVEFGPGWGNTTLALAMMGFDVTAVDIEKNFCNLISRRAEQAGVQVNIINADFSWIEQIIEPVDAVLFFECFHHASDHLRLIKALEKATKEDGKIYFAAEPIIPDFPIPWGLRLDGESLWAIRKFGWLELGFTERYFVQTLKRFGWTVEKHVTDSSTWGTVYEATKWKKYSRKFLASDPMICTQIGIKNDDGLIASNGSVGYLVYGPYISLLTGRYVAAVVFSDIKCLAGKGRVEVACRGGGVILETKEMDFEDFRVSGRIQIEFDNNRRESDVEIRLYCYKEAIAKVYAVEIAEVDTVPLQN